ncbi:MAG TPA: cation diffusion facilitator family transporter [Patescibacteria group bacterium]|nr:cation diffusion facilitator family transporter [Patescibacteria group bacterium]
MSIANPNLQSAESQKVLNLKRWAAVASMTVAVILVVTKLFAFLTTNSVSLLSSLMDSSFDALASLITMILIIHAATPADAEHRFGHGKLEALSALAQAVFVFGSALFLILESVRRFITPLPIYDVAIGVKVMIFSIVLTGVLIGFQTYVIRRTKSVAVSADHMHYRGDLLMNLGVFAALAASYYSPWPYFDPLFAFVIALSLLWGAYGITRESFDILMDKELPDSDREKILGLAAAHPLVQSAHDLRTRSTGERIFIEFHIEVDGKLSVERAHAITEELEEKLYEAFPKSEVLIHQEPAGMEHHRIDDVIPPAKAS